MEARIPNNPPQYDAIMQSEDSLPSIEAPPYTESDQSPPLPGRLAKCFNHHYTEKAFIALALIMMATIALSIGLSASCKMSYWSGKVCQLFEAKPNNYTQ